MEKCVHALILMHIKHYVDKSVCSIETLVWVAIYLEECKLSGNILKEFPILYLSITGLF